MTPEAPVVMSCRGDLLGCVVVMPEGDHRLFVANPLGCSRIQPEILIGIRHRMHTAAAVTECVLVYQNSLLVFDFYKRRLYSGPFTSPARYMRRRSREKCGQSGLVSTMTAVVSGHGSTALTDIQQAGNHLFRSGIRLAAESGVALQGSVSIWQAKPNSIT